jgi:hypothetical protein
MVIFGVTMDTFISRVYKTTLELLNNKADGVLPRYFLQCWVHLFPQFAEVIKEKVNKLQYGALLFDNVRIVVLLDYLHPGNGPIQ